MNITRFSHINALGIKFDLEVGQGQLRFIICANLVGPTSPMLHTKSLGHWSFGSREDIERLFTIYGRGGHLGYVTSKIGIHFG